MFASKRDKKEEEDGGGNPFQSLDKTSVLQEARTFNETPVNPRKCTFILTKILYLMNHGEQLSGTEATEVFFATTRLFQCRDPVLRRLVYVAIKELAGTADDVIIVTSSLTRDMTGKEEMHRSAAIRALCSVTDASMLPGIERYLRQAIVDRNPSVASASLVSALHLARYGGAGAADTIRRWSGEAQEAVNSDTSPMVQFHALGLLLQARKADRLAVAKLVAKLARPSSAPKSPYAVCILIRTACRLLEEESGGAETVSLRNWLESCLRHKSEMVVLEAAQAIVSLHRNAPSGSAAPRELTPAVSVLQLFCSSPKAALRFAAVRTLSRIASTHPAAAAACNLDLEGLIGDANRSVATLAITTLLKTGAEASVDRLMKQIATFVGDISDEFKVVVVSAIRQLCRRYPRKHHVLMGFLAAMLRDEGGLDYKAAIADTIISVIEENPDAKEAGLAHLCEFIEDCEHTSLAVRILHLLGQEGPRAKQPSRYIRFIYNRVILENAAVRASAVSALGRFGAECPQLRENILVLLSRCQLDTDDEVRDRATCCGALLTLLKTAEDIKKRGYEYELLTSSNHDARPNPAALERALFRYCTDPAASRVPFDIASVPVSAPVTGINAGPEEDLITSTTTAPAATLTASREEALMERLRALPPQTTPPQILRLGTPFRSPHPPTALTETGTEYEVQVYKHVFPNHLLLQFDCTNTLADQILEQVRVFVEPPADCGMDLEAETTVSKLACSETATCYVLLSWPPSLVDVQSSVSLPATMKFVVKDCDPATGIPDSDDGYNDEYMLEDIEIGVHDQMRGVGKSSFAQSWDEMAPDEEVFFEREETFALSSMHTLQDACVNVSAFLGMQTCERSDRVPEGKSSHALLLAGEFRTGHQVLAKSKLAMASATPEGGVTMQLTVRSTDASVAELVTAAVG